MTNSNCPFRPLEALYRNSYARRSVALLLVLGASVSISVHSPNIGDESLNCALGSNCITATAPVDLWRSCCTRCNRAPGAIAYSIAECIQHVLASDAPAGLRSVAVRRGRVATAIELKLQASARCSNRSRTLTSPRAEKTIIRAEKFGATRIL